MGGQLRPGTSPVTASALVMTISGGSGFLQKDKVQAAFESWCSGEGGRFSAGAFGVTPDGSGSGTQDVLPNGDFMMGSGFDQAELEDAAAVLSQGGSDRLWDMVQFGKEYETDAYKDIPKYSRWLTIKQIE